MSAAPAALHGLLFNDGGNGNVAGQGGLGGGGYEFIGIGGNGKVANADPTPVTVSDELRPDRRRPPMVIVTRTSRVPELKPTNG